MAAPNERETCFRKLPCGCCHAGCICPAHASPERGIPARTCEAHQLAGRSLQVAKAS